MINKLKFKVMEIYLKSQIKDRGVGRGFTLIEMLIYIGLMSLVIALVAVQSLDLVGASNQIDKFIYANRL